VEKSTFSPQYDVLRKRLVELREGAKLTQRELADRLQVPRSFVARVELGDRRVDLVEFFWICQACGTSPEQVTSHLYREMRRIERRNGGKAPKRKS